jgi:hypothetical protein
MNTDLVSAVLSSKPLQTNAQVQSVLEAYLSLKTNRSVEELRLASLERHALLRATPADQPLDPAAVLANHAVRERSQYTQAVWESIALFEAKLHRMFPMDEYTFSHRVATAEQVALKQQTNGLRVHFDTVGFKIVAHAPLGLIQAVERFEQAGLSMLFRFNTYPFSIKDYRERIGPNSSYSYRAIHYYVSLGLVFAEIQIKTPRVDMWSEIHHCTLYKPTKPITTVDCDAILALGEIANVVDFTGLLK